MPSIQGLLLLAVAASLCAMGQPAALGVDFGSEFIKVTLVEGTQPNIVTNEIGYRKTPAMVGFYAGELRVGETAKASLPKAPLTIIEGLRDMLGQPASAAGNFWSRAYTPYEVSKDAERETVRIKASPDHEYAVEELVGMLLQGIRSFASDVTKMDGVVFAYPPFWTQRQRQALIDAAGVAGLPVLSLLSEPAAAALQYGVDRSPLSGKDSSKFVVIYDIGAGSTHASLVRYSKFVGKSPKGKLGSKNARGGLAVAIPQLEIVGLEWDANLGGRQLDMRLVEHLADAFNAERAASPSSDSPTISDEGEGDGEGGGGSGDVREHPRAMVKLQAAAKKLKETLSLNSDATCHVDTLLDGRDFTLKVTRVEFEELVMDLLERAVEPVRRLLKPKRAGGKAPQVDAVELVGGSIRVPRLLDMLSDVIAGAAGTKVPLGRQLDAEEAVAMGAGLRAANLTAGGMGSRFGMSDTLAYPIELSVKDEGSSATSQKHQLLPRLQLLPWKQTLALKDRGNDFTITVSHAPATGQSSLPPGQDGHVAAYRVSGIRAAAKKHKVGIDVSLTFSLSRSGLFSLQGAQYLPPKAKKKLDLGLEKKARGVQPMAAAALSASARRLRHIQEEAALRRSAAEARSALEGQVLMLRERLEESAAAAAGEEGGEGDAAGGDAGGDEARGALQEALDGLEEWMASEDGGTTASEYKKRARHLRQLETQLLGSGEEDGDSSSSSSSYSDGGGDDAGDSGYGGGGECAAGGGGGCAAAAESAVAELRESVEEDLRELRRQVEDLQEAKGLADLKKEVEGLKEQLDKCGCRI